VALDVGLVQFDVRGDERQRASSRHRVAGVDCQLDDRLLDLGGIGFYGPETVGGLEPQLDVLADGPAQELVEVAQGGVQVEYLRVGDLAVTEDQELAGERRSPLARAADLGEVLLLRARLGQLLGDERGVVEDDREQVVEVVGEAAREPAHRLQALGLVECRLELALALVGTQPVADVPQRADDQPLALAPLRNAGADLNRHQRPIWAPDLERAGSGDVLRSRLQPRPPHLGDHLAIGLGDVVLRRVSDQVRVAAVEQPACRGVAEDDPRVGVEDDDRIGQRVQDAVPAQLGHAGGAIQAATGGAGPGGIGAKLQLRSIRGCLIRRMVPKHRIETGEELVTGRRLADHRTRTEPGGATDDRRVLVPCEDHHPQWRLALDAGGEGFEHLEAVELGHLQVEEQQVELLPFAEGDHLARIRARRDQLEAAFGEDAAEHADALGVVVHHQDAGSSAGRRDASLVVTFRAGLGSRGPLHGLSVDPGGGAGGD
jgi:hypothetical protein